MLLIPNIINYRVKISLAYGTDKVTIRRKFHQEKPPIQPNVSYPLEEIRNLYRITKRGIESGFMLNFTDRTAQDGRNSRSASGFQFIYDPEVEGVLVVFPEDKKELPRIS